MYKQDEDRSYQNLCKKVKQNRFLVLGTFPYLNPFKYKKVTLSACHVTSDGPISNVTEHVLSPRFYTAWRVVGQSQSLCSLDKELDALANGLSADGTGLERRTALYARGMSTLEHQFNVVVDADRTGDALFHLSVSGLQLLQKVVLLRVLCPRTAVHFCLVLSNFLCDCNLTFDALLHSVGTLFTGHAVLTWAEEHQQSQFRADETLAGPGGRGQH